MTDRELLELAARAARYEVQPHPNRKMFADLQFCMGGRNWNPLTNDGDALRLAVQLGVDIGRAQVDYWDKSSNDPYAATRRAIVRAAAEIGKEKT